MLSVRRQSDISTWHLLIWRELKIIPRGLLFIWRELEIIPRGIYLAGALPRGNLNLHPPLYPTHRSSMMFDPSFRRLVENGAKCAVNLFIMSIKGVLLLVIKHA